MKRKQMIFLSLMIFLSAAITWSIAKKDYARSDKEFIYSFSHLMTEFMVFAGALFLIAEAWIHIKKSKDKGIKENLNRHIRILLGIGIITVHIAVLIHGGY